jgi:hypothetical protein
MSWVGVEVWFARLSVVFFGNLALVRKLFTLLNNTRTERIRILAWKSSHGLLRITADKAFFFLTSTTLSPSNSSCDVFYWSSGFSSWPKLHHHSTLTQHILNTSTHPPHTCTSDSQHTWQHFNTSPRQPMWKQPNCQWTCGDLTTHQRHGSTEQGVKIFFDSVTNL